MAKAKSALDLASELLDGGSGNFEVLRIHLFDGNDEEATDDAFIEKLYADFSAEFDRVEAALTQKYGKPSRTGDEDDATIPLNGLFRFAIWPVNDQLLYATATHEDRCAPVLLMLGTTDEAAA